MITRYVPWTSWRAGAQQWGLSSIRQGESSGTITHEIVHTFGIADNNNNPYVTPYRRVGSGPWDIMDRGSFNGPRVAAGGRARGARGAARGRGRTLRRGRGQSPALASRGRRLRQLPVDGGARSP